MPDAKITALTSIGTSTDPANDPLVLVDVSDTSMAASGTTKKVTVNQILGAGGTATLASATITGDLTVDTSTLKVDSANNRVGIGIATPAWPLDIRSATAVAQILSTTGTNAAYLQVSNTGGIFYLGRENSAGTSFASPAYSAVLYAGGAYPLVTTVNGSERYRIASDGVATWSNVGGVAGTAMTLNSTGLGVGGSPTNKLTIGTGAYAAGTLSGTSSLYSTVAQGLVVLTDGLFIGTRTGGDRFTLDTSGNVGIGGNASATGIDTGVARLFVVAPNSNTGMAATFIADSVGRGLLVADQGKTNSFGVEVVAGLVKTGGFTSGTSVALFANAVERARVKSTGQVRFVPLAADPSGAEAGDVYYNSSSNKLKCYNGSTWNDLF